MSSAKPIELVEDVLEQHELESDLTPELVLARSRRIARTIYLRSMLFWLGTVCLTLGYYLAFWELLFDRPTALEAIAVFGLEGLIAHLAYFLILVHLAVPGLIMATASYVALVHRKPSLETCVAIAVRDHQQEGST